MRIIELFAGIGACSTALKRIGKEIEIVDAVEIDKYAIASFNAIHNTKFEPQDIKEWDKDLKNIDLITHGSPCQDFSIAGKQEGGDIGSGTRSSLMYETIRIVGKIRPQYVLWENVKNILSAKHKHNFNAYIDTMKSLGYTSYYKVLNAKEYGIPQNRERVYTISIRNDIKNDFTFPKTEELKLRLKDMLEENVDEKYYLKETQIDKIKTSTYNQNNRRIQEKDFCDTLCARDFKDPKCVRVGGMYGQSTRWGLYDEKGISPTLVAAMGEGGGYVPMVKRVGGIFDNEKEKHQAGSIYDKEGISPTLDAMQGGWRQPSIIEEPKLPGAYGRNFGSKGKIEDEVCSTLQAAMGTGGGNIPLVETNKFIQKKYDEFIEKEGYVPEQFNPYNCSEIKNVAPTQTTQCGSLTSSAAVLLRNDLRIRKLTPKECWRLMGFRDKDFYSAKYGCVIDNETAIKISNSLITKIRFDIEYRKTKTSNTQLYKQAGNSIVVNVLEKIFEELFKEDK